MSKDYLANHKIQSTFNYLSKKIFKNSIYNLLAQGLPMCLAFFSIPIFIKRLGVESYGVLSVVLMIVTYFMVFDMGLGRATTKFVAQFSASQGIKSLATLIWTSIISLFFLGVLGGWVIFICSHWLVEILHVSKHLVNETQHAFCFLGLSLPFMLITIGLKGILEAKQRFDIISSISVLGNIAIYLLPILVLKFTVNLQWIVAIITISRFITCVIIFYFCNRLFPEFQKIELPNVCYLKKLFRYGGWLTISSIIGPIMTYMDRFVVGITIGLSAVAYYSTPYDLITKLSIISGSIIGVAFPIFSALSVENLKVFQKIYSQLLNCMLIILSPIMLGIIIFAGSLLKVWLGDIFVYESTLTLQILAIGVFVNSLAVIPYAAIQAIGRPDITAKLHIIELPIYLGLVWFLTIRIGIVGTAIAWTLRVMVDTALLFLIYQKLKDSFNIPESLNSI